MMVLKCDLGSPERTANMHSSSMRKSGLALKRRLSSSELKRYARQALWTRAGNDPDQTRLLVASIRGEERFILEVAPTAQKARPLRASSLDANPTGEVEPSPEALDVAEAGISE